MHKLKTNNTEMVFSTVVLNELLSIFNTPSTVFSTSICVTRKVAFFIIPIEELSTRIKPFNTKIVCFEKLITVLTQLGLLVLAQQPLLAQAECY